MQRLKVRLLDRKNVRTITDMFGYPTVDDPNRFLSSRRLAARHKLGYPRLCPYENFKF